MGNYCGRDACTRAEGSAGKSLFKTNEESPGMPEAVAVL